ncbi:hypothetical protein E3O44_09820 [Cryobacterium algoricola]|uniref:FtsX-like permease family protein n=1 Tax=Cryobacterium algoricola TaxID=1259183 RepID=A0ABY2ICS7_9MICO|nr:hypothetical protein [Cryobacterium algoricola]TFB87396.1 hypothetical protein E3O44_09820 [Cryobacterium algoricola]
MSTARLASRIALREVKREVARTALIATLIAIPVSILAVGSVVLVSPGAPRLTDRGIAAGAEGGVLVLVLAFVVGLVCLLAGSAFLVAAQAQQRSLGIVASVGTSRAVLVAIVSLTGPLIGGLGGAVGVLAGTGIGCVLVTTSGGEPTVSALLIAVLIAFAAGLGWLAALPPAFAASRPDVVMAIRGSTLPAPRPRHLVLSVVCCVGGGIVALGSGILGVSARQSAAGTFPWLSAVTGPAPFVAAIVLLTGAITATPFLLRRWGVESGKWGLAARLAARDADRNRARHQPVIAAIMGTTFLAVFVLCSQGTADATNRVAYPYLMMPGGVQAALISYPGEQNTTLGPTLAPGTDGDGLAKAVETAFADQLPVGRLTIVETARTAAMDGTVKRMSGVLTPPANRCTSDAPGNDRFTPLAPDPHCRDWYTAGHEVGAVPADIVVGDSSTLAAILGREPSPAALAALDQGEAVALHSQLVDADGSIELAVSGGSATSGLKSVHLEAVVADVTHVLPYGVVISRETAERLGLPTEPSQILATTTRNPTDAELRALADGLAGIPGAAGLAAYFEAGPAEDGASAWLTLVSSLAIVFAAAVVAMTLARTEGRRDSQTLHSIGAAPSTLRTVAAWQALTVVGTGSALGAVIGLVSVFAMDLPGSGSVFAPPWALLVIVAGATPLACAAGAWLLTPSLARYR